jgi:hypothetical protein
MSTFRLCAPAILAFSLLTFTPQTASAIGHGCADPPDIRNVSIDVSLGGRTTTVQGGFCDAVGQAEALIARSSAPDREKAAARETLSELQDLVVAEGRSAAGKVTGSFGCKGTVSTGRGGTTTTVGCELKINF